MDVITSEKLQKILRKCVKNYTATAAIAEIVKQINMMTADRNEAAMFLAHLIHESRAFDLMEIYSARFYTGHKHGDFQGRGYIMLTSEFNYGPASKDIFGDNRLVSNPELVAADLVIGMSVAVWFWEKIVRPKAAPFNTFYATTRTIKNVIKPFQERPYAGIRYQYYLKAAEVLRIQPESWPALLVIFESIESVEVTQ
ncbi:uncharacterized protein LOC128739424 [Sabethes cyaneus]|uniref:uncharacterized protein LOC128739424 n=1 Tax=Sabethes cyaneus TaxID=53552 RepID=UPI00237DEB68|nr:uncharacterized protein LOC128739424 [Sabethes cyaneus]